LSGENKIISERVTSQNEKKKKKKVIIVIALLILLLIVLVLYWHRHMDKQENDTEILVGAGVREGEMEGGEKSNKTDVAGTASNGKSDMTVRMNGHPVFENGESEGNLNIQNPPENVLCMEVVIILDSTGDIIYESGTIPPNHYISNDKLARVLEKGEYNATAHVKLFDSDNPDAEYNSANFALTVTMNH